MAATIAIEEGNIYPSEDFDKVRASIDVGFFYVLDFGVISPNRPRYSSIGMSKKIIKKKHRRSHGQLPCGIIYTDPSNGMKYLMHWVRCVKIEKESGATKKAFFLYPIDWRCIAWAHLYKCNAENNYSVRDVRYNFNEEPVSLSMFRSKKNPEYWHVLIIVSSRSNNYSYKGILKIGSVKHLKSTD